MLKIYEASLNNRNIVLKNYITFENGVYDTGYGFVYAGNNCVRANYDIETFKTFKENLKYVKIEDNYIKNFMLMNPIDNTTLAKKLNDIKKES